MRKIIVSNMISLDGYFEGKAQEIDWHTVDEEFNEYAVDMLDSAGCLLFGRKTYQLMESYWPGPSAMKDDPEVASRMNALPKLVVSRTLKSADWNNTRLISDNVESELMKLKQQEGNDLFILGSSDLCASLLKAGLIDELRIMISPLLLGGGKTMFSGHGQRYKLRLLKIRSFNNGNVLLYYRPEY